jgi:hypothetical protein
LRLRLSWFRGLRARDAATLEALRAGSRSLRRVALPAAGVGMIELEFSDGRVVRLAGVHRRVAAVLDAAVRASSAELIEGAHPGPVWALYFVLGGAVPSRLALLASAAGVAPGSGRGGAGCGDGVPFGPSCLTSA